MSKDKILEIRGEEVCGEMILDKDQENFLPFLHCDVEWHAQRQAYVVRMDEEGKERFLHGRKVSLNQQNILLPDKEYFFPSGAFLAKAGEEDSKNRQWFLSTAERRYLVLKRMVDTEVRKVWLCVDTWAKNNLVILKLKGMQSEQLERFQRSGILLSRVLSYYLPQLRDVGKTRIGREEYVYQCTEYFPGKTLKEKLPLSVPEAIAVFTQVARAIEDMHKAGLWHRNLKPEHILVNEYGQVRLVGLSVIAREKKKAVVESQKDITFSGTVDESEYSDMTLLNESVGDHRYVPFSISEPQMKDLCSVVFLFLYSLQTDEKKMSKVCQLLQRPGNLLQELPSYLPKDMPERIKGLIQDALLAVVQKQTLSMREVVKILEEAQGYVAHSITRQDQYPMPLESQIAMPGAEVAVWYEPMEEVGGDFYNWVPLSKDQYGILVGDMMGHGLKACFYAQSVYPIVSLLSGQRLQPSEILEKMDMVLSRGNKIQEAYFATACYGILCLDRRNLYFHYAIAGHPAPVLYRNGEVSYIRHENSISSGTKLGLGSKYFWAAENFIRLQAGDILLFYSDGILEVKNKENDLYQDYFLEKIAAFAQKDPAPGKLIDALKQDLKNFASGEPWQDDITAIAIAIQ